MLNRFRIQSFKAIGKLDIELDRLTVLVGPNACGKSSVLQAMHALCGMRTRAPEEIFGGSAGLRELTSRKFFRSLPLLRAECHGLEIQWCAGELDDERPPTLNVFQAGKPIDYGPFWQHDDRAGVKEREEEEGLPVLEVLPRVEMFRFEFKDLVAPALVNPRPELTSSGLGLAALLGQMALEYPDRFQRIKQATMSVIPSILDIRLRYTMVPATVGGQRQPMPAHEILFDTKSGQSIPAHAMSDGTMRVLALLTAALGHNPPELILLDDIERGIHPRAMIELVRLLQKTLDELPELQFVATTHSPDLLDQLKPEQIRLLWLGDDGLTQCVAMNEHPDFDTWRDIMTPGEMWSVMDRTGTDRDAS